jgi:adenylosuccinate synthase
MVNVKQLPAKMLEFVEFINKFVGAPVTFISNGPGREQIIEI